MPEQNIFETISDTVDGLNSNELSAALRMMRAARGTLEQIADQTYSEDLIAANAALGVAIEHCGRARHAQQTAYGHLGLYLLHVENGTPSPTRGTQSAGQSLEVSRRMAHGGGIPANIDLTIVRTEHIPPLMDEERNIVWVQVGGKVVPLLESVDTRAYQGYVDNWERFREAGMPVPPLFMRGSNGRLLIPELKQDGSEVYGSGLARDIYRGLPRERPRPGIDATYIHLTSDQHIDAIVSQVRRYAQLASDQKLQLPFHDPFQLYIRPDGSWELTMRDLRAAKDTAKYPYLYTPEELTTRNQQSVALWLVRMKVLRAYLSGGSPVMDTHQLRMLFNPETGRL